MVGIFTKIVEKYYQLLSGSNINNHTITKLTGVNFVKMLINYENRVRSTANWSTIFSFYFPPKIFSYY